MTPPEKIYHRLSSDLPLEMAEAPVASDTIKEENPSMIRTAAAWGGGALDQVGGVAGEELGAVFDTFVESGKNFWKGVGEGKSYLGSFWDSVGPLAEQLRQSGGRVAQAVEGELATFDTSNPELAQQWEEEGSVATVRALMGEVEQALMGVRDGASAVEAADASGRWEGLKVYLYCAGWSEDASVRVAQQSIFGVMQTAQDGGLDQVQVCLEEGVTPALQGEFSLSDWQNESLGHRALLEVSIIILSVATGGVSARARAALGSAAAGRGLLTRAGALLAQVGVQGGEALILFELEKAIKAKDQEVDPELSWQEKAKLMGYAVVGEWLLGGGMGIKMAGPGKRRRGMAVRLGQEAGDGTVLGKFLAREVRNPSSVLPFFRKSRPMQEALLQLRGLSGEQIERVVGLGRDTVGRYRRNHGLILGDLSLEERRSLATLILSNKSPKKVVKEARNKGLVIGEAAVEYWREHRAHELLFNSSGTRSAKDAHQRALEIYEAITMGKGPRDLNAAYNLSPDREIKLREDMGLDPERAVAPRQSLGDFLDQSVIAPGYGFNKLTLKEALPQLRGLAPKEAADLLGIKPSDLNQRIRYKQIDPMPGVAGKDRRRQLVRLIWLNKDIPPAQVVVQARRAGFDIGTGTVEYWRKNLPKFIGTEALSTNREAERFFVELQAGNKSSSDLYGLYGVSPSVQRQLIEGLGIPPTMGRKRKK